MSRDPTKVVVELVRRVQQKERVLDVRLKAATRAKHEHADARGKHRRMLRGAVELREYILARGTSATFVDVMEGLDALIDGRAMPPYWRLSVENAKRERRASVVR